MKWSIASLVALAVTLAACSGNPTGSDPSPLLGLVQAMARDSTGSPPPIPQQPTGTGTIRGTVLAPSTGGGDTLATAPRIVGAMVKVYPVVGQTPLELGAVAASVVTGADGRFQTPTLPAGEYVVTIEPPASSAAIYYGQYIRGMIYAQSGDSQWWVVLAKR